MRTAIFGGSFNPPHVGHVLAVSYVLTVFPVDQVLVVPVFQHVFGKDLASFEQRVEMCTLAMGWIPQVSVSTIERELGGKSRTLDTLEALQKAEPDWSLRLVIGADVLSDRQKWYRWDDVAAMAPPLVLGRAGHPHPEAPMAVLPEVSSSGVREKLAKRDFEGVGALLPRRVVGFIREHQLYEPTQG